MPSMHRLAKLHPLDILVALVRCVAWSLVLGLGVGISLRLLGTSIV